MLRRSGIATAVFFMLASIAWGAGQHLRYQPGRGGGAEQADDGQRHGAHADQLRRGPGHRRYRFSEHSSVEINYSHTANSQIYFAAPLTYRIQGTVAEYSGAYVYISTRAKRSSRSSSRARVRWSFIPATGSSTINDVQTSLPSSRQTRPAFLYGGGFDSRIFSSVPLLRRASLVNYLALRLQYRGLVYKAPSFNVQNLFTGARGHMAEPSVGLVVKF